MNAGLELIAFNMGFGIDEIILLIVLIGCLIFFAKDFRLGAVITFVMMFLLFMLDFALSWDYTKPLIVGLIALVMLAFTLMWSFQQQERGLI